MIDGSTLILILALLIAGPLLLFWLGEKVMKGVERNERDNRRRRPPDEHF